MEVSKDETLGAPLMVQWLRFHSFHCRGYGFDPWTGKLRFHMPRGTALKTTTAKK